MDTFIPTEPDGETGEYTIHFIHGNRLYRFHPRDRGDWYDLDAVLDAIYRAMSDTDVPDRFVALATGDQYAQVVFADPAALRAAAPELGLTLSTDPDDSRKKGEAFEEEVIRELGEPAQ